MPQPEQDKRGEKPKNDSSPAAESAPAGDNPVAGPAVSPPAAEPEKADKKPKITFEQSQDVLFPHSEKNQNGFQINATQYGKLTIGNFGVVGNISGRLKPPGEGESIKDVFEFRGFGVSHETKLGSFGIEKGPQFAGDVDLHLNPRLVPTDVRAFAATSIPVPSHSRKYRNGEFEAGFIEPKLQVETSLSTGLRFGILARIGVKLVSNPKDLGEFGVEARQGFVSGSGAGLDLRANYNVGDGLRDRVIQTVVQGVDKVIGFFKKDD